MASATFAAVNAFLKADRPRVQEGPRPPEWKRLIAVCDHRIQMFIRVPTEENRLRLQDHIAVMGCSRSRKVSARRKEALSMYKELTHGD